MIPCSLTLKNFLSYGNSVQTIDFSPHWLICLSGKNGNGKSALLDAITWAIWGEARKCTGTTKADEGLVRLGALKMMVSLEFIAKKQRYRVRREYTKGISKWSLYVDFSLFDQEKNQFVSLTDKTIKATQEKIEQCVGIDFETFVSSSFVRQGQSNEFSKKSARDRKKILSSILGLGQYDELSRKALEKIREAEAKRKAIVALIEETAPLIENTHEIESSLSLAEQKRGALEKEEREMQEHIKCMYEKRAHMMQALEEKKRIEASLLQEKEIYLSKKEELKNLFEQRRMARKWGRQEEYEKLKIEYAQLQQEEEASCKILVEGKEIYLQLHSLQESIAEREKELHLLFKVKQTNFLQHRLEQEQILKEATKKIAFLHEQTLAARAEKETIKGKKEEIENLLAICSLKEEERKKQVLVSSKRSFYLSLFIERYKQLESKEIQEKKNRQLILERKSGCPLCAQNLAPETAENLCKTIDDNLHFISRRKMRLEQHIIKLRRYGADELKLKKEWETEEAHIKKYRTNKAILEQQEEKLEEILGKEKEERIFLEKQIDFSKKMCASVLLDEEKLLEEEKELTAKDTILVQHLQKKHLLEAKFNAQGAAEERYKFLKSQLKKLAEQIIWIEQGGLQALTRKAEEAVQLVWQLKTQLKHMALQVNIYNSEAEKISHVLEQLKQHEQTIKEIAKTKEETTQQIGMLVQKKETLEQLFKKQETRKEQLALADAFIEDYKHLSNAFGKDGLQALLIEQALPEIEEEANYILSRLSSNHMQIFIEPLKDLKNGNVKETLDINISDAQGTRPYELFSGGEAFRIDFSLRIAVAKLLARRAGTPLETLIIDEGFGSQDEEGLSRLIDAMYAIQKDFAKIIIVSHLPSMKESFPVHFIVQKGPLGSQVTVEERG